MAVVVFLVNIANVHTLGLLTSSNVVSPLLYNGNMQRD
jgi:hypothetical protein